MPAVCWVSVACIGVGFDSSAAVRPMAKQDAEAEPCRRANKWQMAADVPIGAVKPGTTRTPDRTEGISREALACGINGAVYSRLCLTYICIERLV